MDFEVKKSPSGVCWWVLVNGRFLSAFDRKYQAEEYAYTMMKRYV